MYRNTLITLLGAALLLVPAQAFAGDSLLSGYGGPGGGEQVILGSKLLTGGGGKGGMRQRGATPPAVSRSAPLPSDGAAAGLKPLAAAPAGSAAQRAAAKHTNSSSSSARKTVRVGAPLTAAPTLAASRASGDAGSPLGGKDLLLVALGALALVLTAAGTRRLVAGGLQTQGPAADQ
jgi:hypothetical protein